MAKGVITVEVAADTKKASNKIKQLQSELEGSKAIKGVGNDLKALGLDTIGGGIGKLGGLTELGGLGAAAGGVAAGVTAGVAAIGLFVKGLSDIASRGQEAAQAAEKMNTVLTQLSRNFGGTGAGVQAVTKELQLMSANGVNSMEDITAAMQTLTVATKGDVVQAGEMVKAFDDIAAGTGMTVSALAGMTAKIMETGVEQRDLNNLARNGIPIYEALGNVMGITADEAKSMAKEGKIGIDEWNKAVVELGGNFKGLSAAMSSQTLQGSRNTYNAMRSMQNQIAADARNQVEIKWRNERSAEMEESLYDPDKQARLKAEGELAGSIDKLTAQLKEIMDDLPAAFASLFISVADLFNPGAAAKRRKELEESIAFLPNLAGDKASLESFNVGKTSADISGFLKQTKDALKMFPENARLLEQAANLQKALAMKQEEEAKAKAEAAKAEAEAAKAEAERKAGADAAAAYSKMLLEEAKKSGNAEAMLKAYFGEDTLKGTVEEYIAEIEPLENMLKSGAGTPEMVEQLKFLKSVQEAYNKQLADEAEAKRKAAEESAKFEQDLQLQKIEGKAAIGRDIAKEQENLNSITAQLQQLQTARSIVRGNEAHGFYREKWGSLNVSEMESKEAELIKEQQESNQKLKELKDAYDKYDQKWAAVRQKTEAMANKIIQGIVRVKGTALAG